jgi:hypothetical protein
VTVRFHPFQDTIEKIYGLYDMRPLVEHGALGPMAHGRIRDLRSGQGTVFG